MRFVILVIMPFVCLSGCGGDAADNAAPPPVEQSVSTVAPIATEPIHNPSPQLEESDAIESLQTGDFVAAAAAYLLAKDALQKGDFLLAIETYRMAIDHDPQMAIAYAERGLAYAEIGLIDEALGDFEQAIRIEPDMTTVPRIAGIAGYNAYKTGRFDEAIRLCKRAIEMHDAMPRRKSTDNEWRALTNDLLSEAIKKKANGQAAEAPVDESSLKILEETVHMRPQDAIVTHDSPSFDPELVAILKSYSDPSSEREAYRKAKNFIEGNEDNALGHYLYAYGCAMDGKMDDAMHHFQRAVDSGLPLRQQDFASQVVNATAAKPGETTPTIVRVYKALGEVQLDVLRLTDEVSGTRSKEKQAILDKMPEIRSFVTALKFGGPMRVVHEALTGTQHSVSWADGKIGKVPRDWVYDELKEVRVKEWEVFPGTASSQELYEWLEPTGRKVYPLSLDVFRESSVPRMHKWVVHDEPPDALLLVWTEQEVGGSPTRLGGKPTPRETLRKPMLFRWDGRKVTASADAPISEMIRRVEAEAKGE